MDKELKFRQVFRVERPFPEKMTFAQARADFAVVADEAGEYLYAPPEKEKVTVELEFWDSENSRWMEVKTGTTK